MNNRIRMQMKAIELRQTVPIIATLYNENRKWCQIVFIHPDDIEEVREQYGDRLIIWERSDNNA